MLYSSVDRDINEDWERRKKILEEYLGSKIEGNEIEKTYFISQIVIVMYLYVYYVYFLTFMPTSLYG